MNPQPLTRDTARREAHQRQGFRPDEIDAALAASHADEDVSRVIAERDTLRDERDALFDLVEVLLPGALAVLPGGGIPPVLIDDRLNRCRELGLSL